MAVRRTRQRLAVRRVRQRLVVRCTLCFVSNDTKDEDIVQHRDVVESRAIAHMKDIEKLFFVLKFHESRSNSLSFTKI